MSYKELAHLWLDGYTMAPPKDPQFWVEVRKLSGAPHNEPTLEEFQRLCRNVAELQELGFL